MNTDAKFTSNESKSGFALEFFAIIGAPPHNGAPYMYIPFGFIDVRTL